MSRYHLIKSLPWRKGGPTEVGALWDSFCKEIHESRYSDLRAQLADLESDLQNAKEAKKRESSDWQTWLAVAARVRTATERFGPDSVVVSAPIGEVRSLGFEPDFETTIVPEPDDRPVESSRVDGYWLDASLSAPADFYVLAGWTWRTAAENAAARFNLARAEMEVQGRLIQTLTDRISFLANALFLRRLYGKVPKWDELQPADKLSGNAHSEVVAYRELLLDRLEQIGIAHEASVDHLCDGSNDGCFQGQIENLLKDFGERNGYGSTWSRKVLTAAGCLVHGGKGNTGKGLRPTVDKILEFSE